MKKLFLILTIISVRFLISNSAFAYVECSQADTIPCTYNGNDYNGYYHHYLGGSYFLNSEHCRIEDGNNVNHWDDISSGVTYNLICEYPFPALVFYQ
ncbi:MAG: hypothetical protein Athens071416_605, partial [Parcubacteria group bacterium Athens0714_16]